MNHRMRSRIAALSVGAVVASMGLGAAPAAATGGALVWNQTPPITAAEYPSQQTVCDEQPDGTDGWHFVAPSGSFLSLSAYFDTSGDGVSDVTETLGAGEFGPPSDQHAYVYSDVGAVLVNATATGTAAGEKFNLSHTCPGADLEVSKTAVTSFTRTYDWTISKAADPAVLNLFSGDTGETTWTVGVTKGPGVDGGWAVEGDITIVNDEPYDATITGVSDIISGVGSVDVDCGAITFPYLLPKEPDVGVSQLVCSYSSTLPDGSARTNTATVTTTGWVGGGSGSAPVSFAGVQPTIVGGSVSVTDTNGEAWGPVSSSTSWSYDEPFTCNADEGKHDNTATITGTTKSATASVTVNCYDLTVTKDAATSFSRDWDWTIEKKGYKTDGSPADELTLSTDQSYVVDYEVKVTATPVDSDFAVTEGVNGIEIYNPAPMAAEITSVSDVITAAGKNPVTADVDCGEVTFPYSLASLQTLSCTYSAALGDGSKRLNTATATLQNYDYTGESPAKDGTTNFSGTADVDFADAVVTQSDQCVDISDPLLNGGVAQEVCAGQTRSWTIEYSATIGPYEECGEYEFPNTASLATDDSVIKTSSWNVDVLVPCPGCTLTIGYWKTHSPYFKDGAKNDPAWALLAATGHDTAAVYQILTTPPKGDAYYILAHQYIGATLNVLSGASLTGSAKTAYDQATALIHNPAFGPGKVPKAQRATWLALAATLDQYNNGYIGPGHCDQQV